MCSRCIIIICLFSLISINKVLSAPPDPGSEDYEALSPYSDWIEKQTGHYGGLCCSLQDCRTTKWRNHDGHLEAFISRMDSRGFTKWQDGPNDWVQVPSEVVKREGNPTGEAIFCWSKYRMQENGFYCAFLPDLT